MLQSKPDLASGAVTDLDTSVYGGGERLRCETDLANDDNFRLWFCLLTVAEQL